MNIPPFAFFGTSRFSVILLDEMKNKFAIVPEVIVTTPDRPVGRKQVITPPPAKVWALENNIEVLQPEKLNDESFIEEIKKYDLFVVASYGKIIPKAILDIPSKGALNVHPSLLPHYRGASPIQSQIINNEKHVGTTIMMMDEGMDHGPLLRQQEITFDNNEFPAPYLEIEERLAKESAPLLFDVLSSLESATPQEQDHDKATYTKIIEKSDGEISLSGNALQNYLKYLAYHEWPKVFFFFEKDGKQMRAVITDTSYENDAFVVKSVVPEGKNEMSYDSFLEMTKNG